MDKSQKRIRIFKTRGEMMCTLALETGTNCTENDILDVDHEVNILVPKANIPSDVEDSDDDEEGDVELEVELNKFFHVQREFGIDPDAVVVTCIDPNSQSVQDVHVDIEKMESDAQDEQEFVDGVDLDLLVLQSIPNDRTQEVRRLATNDGIQDTFQLASCDVLADATNVLDELSQPGTSTTLPVARVLRSSTLQTASTAPHPDQKPSSSNEVLREGGNDQTRSGKPSDVLADPTNVVELCQPGTSTLPAARVLRSSVLHTAPAVTHPEQQSSSSNEVPREGRNDKTRSSKKKNPKKPVFEWKDNTFQAMSCLPNDDFPAQPDKKPLDYFREFFTDELINLMCEQSNLYSVQQNGTSIGIGKNDISDFLAVELLMGIVKMRSYKDYWSTEFRYEKIASIMSRNQYQKIRRYLHFSDNTHNADDKFAKIRPLVEYLRQRFLEIPEEKKMSIDEMMIKYKGKKAGSRRQYMKNKPTKWGFKMFVRSGVSGVVYDFLLYSGSDMLSQYMFGEEEIEHLTYSNLVVVALAQTIKDPSNTAIYFDNWFCSPELIWLLKKIHGILSLGTLRSDRSSGASKMMADDKEMMRCGRGSYDEVTDASKSVTVIKWFDNKAVTLTSSYVGSEPVGRVKRWDGGQRAYINVTCPRIILEYNSFMGGVDVGGMLVALYRTPQKSKKWYMPIFSHFLDLAVNNSWLLFKRDCPESKMTLKEFRNDVANCLLMYKRTNKRGRPSTTPPTTKKCRVIPVPNHAIVSDGVGHLPDHTNKGKCRFCSDTTTVMCVKCKLRLCLVRNKNCFLTYHEAFSD